MTNYKNILSGVLLLLAMGISMHGMCISRAAMRMGFRSSVQKPRLLHTIHKKSESSIKNINSFGQVNKIFNKVNSNTLMIFDIVGTLIKPEKYDFYKQLKPGYQKDQYEAPDEKLLSLKMLNHPREITEPVLIQIIKTLKTKGAHVIALSHWRVGQFGYINLQELRFRQLKALGIEFSDSTKHIVLDKFFEFNGTKPVFYKGLLFTNNYSKGAVLVEYLKQINWKPEKIIVFDDVRDYLVSIEQETQKLSIPVCGYHYKP